MAEYEQITSILDKTSHILASWLEKALPELSPKWWEYKVITKLSFAQSNRVRNKGINSLSGLDLAALLRILDHNWNELGPKHKLFYEDRHFLKEMLNIRNRWAHKPIVGYEQDYIFRDLDTIQRFITLIAPDEILINQIKEVKTSVFEPSKKNTQEITNEPLPPVSSQQLQSDKDILPQSDSSITKSVMSKEKREIILNRAKNLAIRVPWQDNGWIGHVCKNPQKNISCLHLRSIADNRDLPFECPLAGKEISELSKDEIKKLPCLKENSAFLSDKNYVFYAEYPYSSYTELTHIIPTQVKICPNSLISRPFRWLRTEDTPATTIITGYNKRREEVFKASHKNNKGYPIKKTWINEPLNQKAIIEYYYDGLCEKSLLVPYLKNVPFTDDSRRIVLGVGFVKKVHDSQHYESSDKNITDMPVLWDKVIEHDIINNGFLIPYKELYDYWVKNNQPDIDDYILFVDDEYRSEFMNGSEPVSFDALLTILDKSRDILLAISRDIPSVTFDYYYKSKWIEEQITKLSKERGVFPAIGNLLLASKIFVVPIDKEDKNIALDVLKEVFFDGSTDSIELLKTTISNEKRLTEKQKEMARIFITDNLTLIYNLSRFTFTEEQFVFILNNKEKYSIDNPYLLFENSLNEKDELKIPLNKIDNGIFFDRETQKTIPGLILLDTDSKERLRAFIIRELDEQAQKNGHSLLPLDYLIELINKRNLIHKLNFNKDDFEISTYKEYIEEKVIFNENSDGKMYLKLRSIDEYDKASINEINVRLKSEKISIESSNFEEILTESLMSFSGNDTEEGKEAKKEKLTALNKLSINKISVLIGDAGTGKTTVLAAFCKHDDIKTKVQLLAPTGKARVRMWDATGKQYDTKTIAQFLIADKCFDWKTGRYIVPDKSKVELSGANVIIDESSMLTTEMFAAVLKSCSQAKRIIFVGDPNQLPPIGCGKPFSDLVDYLQKEYPDNVARLTCVMRTEMSETNDFASWFKSDSSYNEIVFDKVEANTNAIKGIRFRQYDDLQETLIDEIVKITGMKNKDDIQGFDISLGGIINGQYTNFNTGGFFGIPKDQGAGAKAENWQILSPIKNSPDGTLGVNDLIHNKYRPTSFFNGREKNNYYSKVEGIQKIGIGDKVICTENGHSDPYPKNNFNYIANGEIGIRVSSAKGTDFPNVEFSTQLGVAYWGKKSIKGTMYRWSYKGDEDDGNLELAYAITIHKAQGSQFDNVILVLNKNSSMLSRELIYTAITRQRKGLVILFNDNIRELLKYSGDLRSDLAKRFTDLFNPPKFINLSDGWYEESKIHKTKRGDMVRSKSEVIIANELENAELDWHYENDNQFIEIEGKKLLPDFVIHHNGKTYYWEHLGFLNNTRYKKAWEDKEKYYLRDKNIILKTTKDAPNGAINSDDVLKIIGEIING